MRFSRYLQAIAGLLLLAGHSFADDDSARQIVDKAIRQLGDNDKVGKHQGLTSKLKGTLHLFGAPLPFRGEMNSQGPRQYRISLSLEVDGQSTEYVSVINGDNGWIKLQDNTSAMSLEQRADARDEAYLTWVSSLVPLRDKAFQLAPMGEIEVDKKKLVGVAVTREGHRAVNLYFDKETFRLTRTETQMKDDVTYKEMTQETTYSEYKPFDGIQHATRISIKRDGQPRADVEVELYKSSEKLDDSVFAKP